MPLWRSLCETSTLNILGTPSSLFERQGSGMIRTTFYNSSTPQNINWKSNRYTTNSSLQPPHSHPLYASLHIEAFGLVFNYTCRSEKHWGAINASQSGSGESDTRKVSWFQMGEEPSSQGSICWTNKIGTCSGWVISCKTFYHLYTSFYISLIVEFIGRGDGDKCKEGSWFDRSWNPSIFGIGYLSFLLSSFFWISGTNRTIFPPPSLLF